MNIKDALRDVLNMEDISGLLANTVYEFPQTFIDHTESLDSGYLFFIAQLIKSMINNKNLLHSKQFQGVPFKHEPLKGLYKAHVIDSSYESTCKNFGFDIQKSVKRNAKKIRAGSDIDFMISMEVDRAWRIYQKRQNEDCLTGNWLIFGKQNGKNIYLKLHIATSHASINDEAIYEELIQMYSLSFIENLKSGK